MIYILTYSMLMPGTSTGYVSDLFEDAFTDIVKAEKAYKELALSREYFRKELWVKEPGGRRKLLKEERYKGEVK